MANVGAGLFMGMPVTSVIARSGLNASAGAQTRLPALIQAGVVFGSIAFAGPAIAMIPMPALSGMLIKTGASMLYPPEFNYCYSVDNTTTLPFFTTVAGMLSMGLAEGISIGCATAVGLAVHKAVGLAVHKNMQLQVIMQVDQTSGVEAVNTTEAQIKMVCNKSGVKTTDADTLVVTGASNVWQVKGPINFMSMFEIDNLVEDIKDSSNSVDPIVLDMRHVTSLDFTGMEELVVRVIEAANGAPVQMVTRRDDINNVMNKIDKEGEIHRFSAINLEQA
jgi:MFS superfamily sulfate permease-like transporter